MEVYDADDLRHLPSFNDVDGPYYLDMDLSVDDTGEAVSSEPTIALVDATSSVLPARMAHITPTHQKASKKAPALRKIGTNVRVYSIRKSIFHCLSVDQKKYLPSTDLIPDITAML